MATAKWHENENRWIIDVKVDGVRKRFTSVKKGKEGKKEVEAKANDFRNGSSTNRQKLTVCDVWDRFIESVELAHGKDSEALKQYRKLGRLYILPSIGKKRISAVRKDELQAILNNAKPHNSRTDSLSKKYLTSIRMTISLFFKWAYENEYCEPIRGSLYIPAGHSVKEREILQPDQLRRLFEPSELHYWRAICFCVLCGLRPSELLGLQWEDIHQGQGGEGSYLTIQRGVTTSGKISQGKTSNAKRFIPLSSYCLKILNEQKFATAKLKSIWVFCSEVGGMGSQSTLGNHYRELKEERNLAGSLYSLRHTFVSLTKNTLSESQIKTIVGHSSQMNTFDVYGHRVDGDDLKVISLLEKSFEQIQQ